MTALRPVTSVEVSCRNDRAARVGDRVTVLEWADPRRRTQGRVAVAGAQAAGHAMRLGTPGRVEIRAVGDGEVARVIQWFQVGGLAVPARVVLLLHGAGRQA